MSSVLVSLVISSTIVHVASFALRSSVAVTGTRVELNCCINENDSATWTYISWNTSTETSIYLGKDIVASMRSRYKIDMSISGQHNLVIDSVDLAHAGRYRCTGVQNQSLVNDIELTVLASPPMCFANTSSMVEANTEQGHYLWLWCSIVYTGNIIPIFTWSKGNTALAANTTDSGTSGLPSTTISSVNRHIQSDDNGATFKCKITFPLPSISDGNTTDFEYTWSYALFSADSISLWSISTVGLVLIITSFTVLGIVLLGIGLKLTRLSNTFDEVSDKAPAEKPSFQPQQPSKGPDSPASTVGDTKLHGTDATVNYCALTNRPTAAQEPQVYCELRSLGEQSATSSPSKQDAENKHQLHANVGLHESQL